MIETPIAPAAAPKPRKKRRRRLPLVVWPEDWQKLLKAGSGSRDTAIIAIGLYAGLRISEIAALELADVDVPGRMLHIKAGKGDKEAWQPLALSAVPYVTHWLENRRMLFNLDESDQPTAHTPTLADVAALFPSRRGQGRLTARQMFTCVREAGERAGLGELIHPHTLRHSCGTALLERGVPLEEVRDFLRHEDIRSTLIYIHLRRDKRRAAADKL